MTLLPIVARELRVASRKRRTYWTRSIAAGIGVIVLLYLVGVIDNRMNFGGYLGPTLFHALGMLCFVFCLLAGVSSTSDCLAAEKREGTLGLLFLTDLKGFDVVLGKMAASSLGSLYHLLAMLPILTVPLLLGGVERETVLWLAALLLGTLLFSLAIGVAVSAVCRDDRRAMSLTLAIIVAITGGLPLCGAGLEDSFPQLRPADVMAFYLPSPAFAYYQLGQGTDQFWLSLATIAGLSVGMISFACLWLPRSWQERGQSKRSELLEAKFQAAINPPDRRLQWRAALLDHNPFLWLCARKRIGPLLVWGTLGLAGAVWLICAWRYPQDFFDQSTYVMTAFFSHLLLKLWFTTEACRRFADDRRSGALELLLSTPLDPKTILQGQFLALKRMFLGPAIALLLMDVLIIIAFWADGFATRRMMNSDQRMEFTLLFGCGMAVFVTDLLALAWLGPWLALNAHNGAKAASGAVLRVLALPWAAFAASLLLLIPLITRFSPSEEFFTLLWTGVCLANNLIWFRWARAGLNRSFRDRATTRFDAGKAGWFAQWWNRGAT